MSEYIFARTLAPTDFVALEEAKEHLRVDFSDEDSLITNLIKAAIQSLDGLGGLTGRANGAQRWKMSMRYTKCWRVNLPLNPVTSIESIKYYDANNVLQTANLADFALIADDNSAYIEPIAGKSWPSTYYRADALQIEFNCGGTVADTIKMAALLLVATWYQNREGSDIPNAVYNLVNLNKTGWIA